MKKIRTEENYDIIDIKTVLPNLLYLDADLDDYDISKRVLKKLDKNMEKWYELPEDTFEQLRYKMHILLGTVFINEHMVGWGEVSFDKRLSDWVKGKVDEVLDDFTNDEELFNQLVETDMIDDFTSFCPMGEYVFKLTDDQIEMDEDDRPMSFGDIINTCIEENEHYTYAKILGLTYGWSFADAEICEQFDDDWDVVICKYNS
jgi:hypothetical protein